MRQTPFVPLFLVLSAPFLNAQGEVAPAELTTWSVASAFDPANQPYSTAQQIYIIKRPGMAAKDWYVGLTTSGLPANLGGVGGSDVVTGIYDSIADTFTPNDDCLLLNGPSDDFGFTIHHSGQYAVWDRISAGIAFTSWDSVNTQWNAPQTVTGVANESYYDPVLADLLQPNGTVETWLFWVSGNTNIVGAPIDLSSASVTASPTTFVQNHQAGSTANSPTPILNASGELLGFSHHDVLNSAGDNDQYFSFDLDPTTPSMGPWNDTTTWINNGSRIGGRIFSCHWAPSPNRIWYADTFLLNGGRCKGGTTLEISAHVAPNQPVPVLSGLLLSSSFVSPSIPIPGVAGEWGLTTILYVPALGAHDLTTGTVSATFPVPTTFPGIIPIQAFNIEPVSGQIQLSNTAVIQIL